MSRFHGDTLLDKVSENRFDSALYNDWIINCNRTKFHHFMSTRVLSTLRSFRVRRGFLEIFFLPKFQKKFSYKTVMILCHTSDLTKFQTLQRV